jgi:hypothetical protein
MRFSKLTIAIIMAPLASLASPLASLAPPLAPVVSSGSVVTNKGITYEMSQLNETKAFNNKVDHGEYPRPVTYRVNAGYSCIFYT